MPSSQYHIGKKFEERNNKTNKKYTHVIHTCTRACELEQQLYYEKKVEEFWCVSKILVMPGSIFGIILIFSTLAIWRIYL